MVLVPKKDGLYQFCVNYRRLDSITVRDAYTISRMDECIESLGDAKMLECNWSYLKIPLKVYERDKTTFV